MTNEENCFKILEDYSIIYVLIYAFLVILTDYSLILCALYIFCRGARGLPSKVHYIQEILISSDGIETDQELEGEEEERKETETENESPRKLFRPRSNSSSLNDYILYST